MQISRVAELFIQGTLSQLTLHLLLSVLFILGLLAHKQT